MTPNVNDLKNEIGNSLTRLQTLRDEVRVRLHLAGMDAKDRWDEIESHLADVERSAGQISDASRAAIKQAIERVEGFLDSLK
ncbi:MAG TPA: hypothetical protein VFS43_30600 [Polyangiaceae bacterium]|nr:hypothetical protein [Polyangiaceae bacterium]